MSLKHGLLGLLSYSDMTGYELGKAFQDSLSLSRTNAFIPLPKTEGKNWQRGFPHLCRTN